MYYIPLKSKYNEQYQLKVPYNQKMNYPNKIYLSFQISMMYHILQAASFLIYMLLIQLWLDIDYEELEINVLTNEGSGPGVPILLLLQPITLCVWVKGSIVYICKQIVSRYGCWYNVIVMVDKTSTMDEYDWILLLFVQTLIFLQYISNYKYINLNIYLCYYQKY